MPDKHPHEDRKPAFTSWIVREDDEPENWTVNVSLDIIQLAVLRDFLARASIGFAKDNKMEHAMLAYYWMEDVQLRHNELGGDETSARKAIEEMQRRERGEID